MKRFFGIVLIVVGFFIAFLTIRGSVFFETAEVTAGGKKLVELRDVKELMIESSSIDIDVRKADGDDLTIELEGRGANKAEVFSEHRGEQLIIEARKRKDFSFNFNFFSSTKLIVYLPDSYKNKVAIKTSSGDVTVSGERSFSSLQVTTSSGDVEQLAGSFSQFDYRSSSGDLTASKLVVNEATIKTSSGDICVKDFAGKLEGSSSSGDALIEFAHANDDVRWNSSSGDLILRIPEPSYTLELSTSSGELIVETPHERISHQKKHMIAKVGEGNKQLIVNTSSGDVIVK